METANICILIHPLFLVNNLLWNGRQTFPGHRDLLKGFIYHFKLFQSTCTSLPFLLLYDIRFESLLNPLHKNSISLVYSMKQRSIISIRMLVYFWQKGNVANRQCIKIISLVSWIIHVYENQNFTFLSVYNTYLTCAIILIFCLPRPLNARHHLAHSINIKWMTTHVRPFMCCFIIHIFLCIRSASILDTTREGCRSIPEICHQHTDTVQDES